MLTEIHMRLFTLTASMRPPRERGGNVKKAFKALNKNLLQ